VTISSSATAARGIFAPASRLLAQSPERFDSLAEMTRSHAAFSSAKAMAHVPAFRPSALAMGLVVEEA
jgi:hypothetical protein